MEDVHIMESKVWRTTRRPLFPAGKCRNCPGGVCTVLGVYCLMCVKNAFIGFGLVQIA